MKEYKVMCEGEDISDKLSDLGFEVVRKLRLVEPATYFVKYTGDVKKEDDSFIALGKIEGLEYCLSKEYKILDGSE